MASAAARCVAEALRDESHSTKLYVLLKLEECADQMAETTEVRGADAGSVQTDRARECLAWLGSSEDEEVVDVVISTFKPCVLKSEDTIARLIGGKRLHEMAFAVQRSVAFFAYTVTTTALFACILPLSLVVSEHPLVPYWFSVATILSLLFGYAFAGLLFNKTSLKTLFYSFDLWYMLANALITGLAGGYIFATPEQGSLWRLAFMVPLPLSLFFDAHPGKKSGGGHYFAILLCAILLGLAVFFGWFDIVPTRVYVAGQDISLTNRCYSALSNVAIFLARFVRQRIVDKTKYVMQPAVRERRVSKQEAARITKMALVMREQMRRAQRQTKKRLRRANQVAPTDTQVSSIATCTTTTEILKAKHMCQVVSAMILLELHKGKEKEKEMTEGRQWQGDPDDARTLVLKVASEISREMGRVQEGVERHSTTMARMLDSTRFRLTAKQKKKHQRDRAKLRDLATVKMLLPTQRLMICDGCDSLAHAFGGSKMHRLVRRICRNKIFQATTFVNVVCMFFFSLKALHAGSDRDAACAILFSIASSVSQIIQLGLCRMTLLKRYRRSFSVLFFFAISSSVAINALLCGSTVLQGAQVFSLCSLVASPYLLFDAMPFRRHTRLAMTFSVILLLLYYCIIFWLVWQELTPAFEDYEINIFGQSLSARQTMLSSTASGAVFIAQFIYRALSSRSRLIFLPGLENFRVRRDQARLMASVSDF